jgi:hypothetical protein
VGLERGPLSLVSTIEELLGRNSSGSGPEIENTAVGNCQTNHVVSYISKRWHYLRRQASDARSVEFARGLRPRSLV